MINRNATIRWKGYDPDELKPQSSARVWANCDECGEGRWVYRFAYSDLCMRCSRTIKYQFPNPKFIVEKDRFIPCTKIDRIITIEKMGYDPINLGDKSGKMVWSICTDCNEGRLVSRCNHDCLCQKCSSILLGHILREKYKPLKPKYFVKEKYRFIPGTGIDRIETIKVMGYDPIDLSRCSDNKVWCICQDCGSGRWCKKGNYCDLCLSCARILDWQLPEPVFVLDSDRFILNTRIDRIITIYEKGYDPADLSYGSSKEVWMVCKKCGVGRWSVYCQYHDICADCSRRSRSGENSPTWMGGISFGSYCEKFNFEFKEYIRNLFNRLCFLCGMGEEENGRRLDVHHTNYDKDCLCNSSCEFVPLCQRCHGKTNHKRQYWEDLIMCYLYPNRITMVDL